MVCRRIMQGAVCLGALALMLLCCSTDPPTAGAGGSEVWAQLVDRNDDPVSGAVVDLYFADPNTFDTIVVASAQSKETGEVRFASLKRGNYALYGDFRNSGVRLVGSTKFTYDSSRKDLGKITMSEPGTVRGQVIIDRANKSGILVYIPETRYVTLTGDNGAFVLSGIVPDTYHVHILADFRFETYRTEVIINSGDTIDLGEVFLNYQSVSYVEMRGLTCEYYDTLSGTVSLSWEPVNLPPDATYQVAVDMGTGTFVPLEPGTADPFYEHRAFPDTTSPGPLKRVYRVRATDGANASPFSAPCTVLAVSPNLVRTYLDLRTTSDRDTQAIGDTVKIALRFWNQTRANVEVNWAVGHPDSLTRNRLLAVPSKMGSDTLRFVRSSPGLVSIFAAITDAAGTVWNKEVVVPVFGDPLPVNQWLPGANLSASRASLGVAALDGKIYAAGGIKYPLSQLSGPSTSNKLEVLDPDSSQWKTLAPMPVSRFGFTLVSFQGRLYAIGGSFLSGGSGQDLATVDEYDPQTNSWKTIDTMPAPRVRLAAAACNGAVYVVGGIVGKGAAKKVTGSIDRFDPVTRTWTHVGDLNSPTYDHQVLAHEGRLYIIGGARGDSSEVDCSTSGDVDLFDVDEKALSSVPHLLHVRKNFVAGVINGKLYVAGGLEEEKPALVSSVEEYVPGGSSWTEKAPMVARYLAGAAVVKNRLFVVGGSLTIPNRESNMVEIFFP